MRSASVKRLAERDFIDVSDAIDSMVPEPLSVEEKIRRARDYMFDDSYMPPAPYVVFRSREAAEAFAYYFGVGFYSESATDASSSAEAPAQAPSRDTPGTTSGR